MSTEITAPAKNGAKSLIPTLDQLVDETELTIKENNLMVLLNQPPPDKWLAEHQGRKYLPIGRVEYLLTRIYIKWWVEVKSAQIMANSSVVTVRLFVVNPITRATEWQDGIGASPIQTDAGKGAMEWNHTKNDGVMKSVPAAESYAIKDAAEKFGKLFGKDLQRKEQIGYDTLLKEKPDYDWVALRELFDLKKSVFPSTDYVNAERIINEQEKTSYLKLKEKLSAL